MDGRFIWPLVGVFLGWMLTSITIARKDREENRRLVGRLLSKLIDVHCDVQLLKTVTETFKDYAGNWENFESIRHRAMNKHFLEPTSKMKLLEESIHAFSGPYPVESFHLQSLKDLLIKAKNTSFTSTSKNRDIYIKVLSAHEVVIDHLGSELLKTIKSLSAKHSLVTYFKVILLLRKRRKRFEASNDFFSSHFDDVLSLLGEKPS